MTPDDMDTDARRSWELGLAWQRTRLMSLKAQGREWTPAELSEAYRMMSKGHTFRHITEQLRKTNRNRTLADVIAAIGEK